MASALPAWYQLRRRPPSQLSMCSCRQPEKILLPPEFTVSLEQPSQFGTLMGNELALDAGAEITTVNA